MKLIKVHLKEKSYDIAVGDNILGSFGRFLRKLDCGQEAIVVTNAVIKNYWGKRLSGTLNQNGIGVKFEEIPDTEKSKSVKIFSALLDKIAYFGKAKRIFLVAFGGGVVGDLTGFVASVYKRGVPYVQLPTTLMAQVDSAIGGKVAIDLKAGKNLVGSFYQPRLVFSEIGFIGTLPRRQLLNGMSEVIKYAVIKDPALFEYLEKNLSHIFNLNKASLEYIISAASRIKARIVEQDEYDRLGIRAVLNYGHTIGHAIESASGYSKKYSHGEAISIGMVAANFISNKLGLISESTCARIQNLIKKAGLPTKAWGINPEKVYEAHLYDKKFKGARNRFVLSIRIGQTKIVEGVSDRLVKKAINSICERR